MNILLALNEQDLLDNVLSTTTTINECSTCEYDIPIYFTESGEKMDPTYYPISCHNSLFYSEICVNQKCTILIRMGHHLIFYDTKEANENLLDFIIPIPLMCFKKCKITLISEKRMTLVTIRSLNFASEYIVLLVNSNIEFKFQDKSLDKENRIRFLHGEVAPMRSSTYYELYINDLKKQIENIKHKAATTIQKGCHNWLYKGKCKDNTIGIVPRLEWEKIQETYKDQK
jgi:hypothetical protein